MAAILPPDLTSATFLIAVFVPLILGFIVGYIAKNALKIGVAIALILLILIVLGVLTPSQILTPLLGLVKSGSSLTSEVQKVAGYLPYSSITFLIGLAIGFIKG